MFQMNVLENIMVRQFVICIWKMQEKKMGNSGKHVLIIRQVQFKGVMIFQGNTRVTLGQFSGQLIWNAYVRASLWSITWSAIGDFVFCISNISFFVGAIYVCGWHGFTCISGQHCVRFTMVECTGVPFDVSWVGMHPPRALDNAQGMFHMGSWNFRTGNSAPGICQKMTKSEVQERRVSEKKGSTSHPAR